MLRTERLLLRPWADDDREPFAEMNADPAVMQHFPSVLTREESDAIVTRIRRHFDERGFGMWAVEVVGGAPFIGFVGISSPRFQAKFTPCVEVGWRLARAHWDKGYASEGARAAVKAGFEQYGLDEIVSMTVPGNVRSRHVMEKLGMTRDPAEDFLHPLIDPTSLVAHHVLYRLTKTHWAGSFQ